MEATAEVVASGLGNLSDGRLSLATTRAAAGHVEPPGKEAQAKKGGEGSREKADD